MKPILVILTLILTSCSLQAQTDTYDQLKDQYDSLQKEKKFEDALVIAKQMNAWVLQNDSDTSLRYAVSLRYVGNCYYSLEKIDSSIYFHRLGKTILENNNNLISEEYASALNNLGIIYKEMGYSDSALTFFYELTSIREKLINVEPFQEAVNYSNIAQCYTNIANDNLALQFYLKSLNYFETINYSSNWCKYLFDRIALTYFYLNQIDSAIAFQYKRLKIIEIENPGSMDYAISISNLAKGYTLLNDYKSVDSLYSLSIQIAFNQPSIDTSFILDINLLKLEYLLEVEQLEMLEMQLNQFEEIYKKYDPVLYCKHLNVKGMYYNRVSLNHIASKYFLEALNICKKYGQENSSIAKGIMANLGVSYYQSYQIDKALEFYMKSIEDVPLNSEVCNTIYNIGILYLYLKNYDEANKYLINAKSCVQSNTMKHSINLFISRMYSELKNLDSSIVYLNFADSLLKEIKTESVDFVVPYLYESAVIYSNLGELEKSNEAIDKALNQVINHNYKRPLTAGILKFRIKQRRAEDSDNEIELFISKLKEYEINNTRNNFNWLSSVEKKHFINSLLKSKDFIVKSIFENKSIDGENGFDIVSFTKSLLLETSRELDQAIAQSFDDEMKTQFFEMKQLRKLYSKMQSEGSTNKEIMERLNREADSLDKILVNSLGEYAASKRKFEINWKDIQSNLNPTEAAIEFAKYYDDKDSVYKYMALVVRPDYEYPKITLLGEEERIGELIENRAFEALYPMVWEPIEKHLSGVKRVYYSPAGQLNNLSFSALCMGERRELTQQEKDDMIARGEPLDESTSSFECEYLMDRYELHQLTTTRYIADGTLDKKTTMNTSIALGGGINYDTVPKAYSENKEEDYAEYNFALNLIQKQEQEKAKENTKRSSKNTSSMKYLEGTKKEVDHVAALFQNKNWSLSAYTDTKAEEGKFKEEVEKNKVGIIHIATHGFAFPDVKKNKRQQQIMGTEEISYRASEDPMVRCGLMFSGSNVSWTGNPQKMIKETGEDGILTAAEVSNMDLSNTKLVVLSACETGLGKIEGSEGTFGLKRGFKLAGVEQMIVSLWSVPDKETMELMTLFYEDLTESLNPVKSFKKAQKQMRETYPTRPDLWAGFVLVR